MKLYYHKTVWKNVKLCLKLLLHQIIKTILLYLYNIIYKYKKAKIFLILLRMTINCTYISSIYIIYIISSSTNF